MVVSEANKFVGRDKELARLHDLLPTSPVLVVVGPGGCGKTRLVDEFVRRNEQDFDSTLYCGLSAAKTKGEFVAKVGRDLGVTNGSLRDADEVLGAIADRLSRGKQLVVLDNFEQLSTKSDQALEVLSTLAPTVRFVVTSRRTLQVSTAAIERIEPLALEPAVELFNLRARTYDSCWQGDPEVVSRICQRLDRLPLAIELAASQVRLLDVDAMDRLLEENSLRMKGGALRRVIEWSWDLLSETEQRVLVGCSLFSRDFTVELAQEVLGEALGQDEWIGDVLEALLRGSLLRSRRRRLGERDEIVLSLFEAVREFALERVDELPGIKRVRKSFVSSILSRAERMSLDDDNPDGLVQKEALLFLEPDLRRTHDLSESSERVDPEAGHHRWSAARLLARIYRINGPFYLFDDYLKQARERADKEGVDPLPIVLEETYFHTFKGEIPRAIGLLEKVLGAAQKSPPKEKRWLLDAICAQAILLRSIGRIDESLKTFQRGVELAGQWQKPINKAHLLLSQAEHRSMQGVHQESLEMYNEALELFRAHSHRSNEADALMGLAGVYRKKEDFSLTRVYLERSLALVENLKDPTLEGYICKNLAVLELDFGNYQQAITYSTRAVEIFSKLGRAVDIAAGTGTRATALLLSGRTAEAEACFHEIISPKRSRRRGWPKVFDLHKGHLAVLFWEKGISGEPDHRDQAWHLLQEVIESSRAHRASRTEVLLSPFLAGLSAWYESSEEVNARFQTARSLAEENGASAQLEILHLFEAMRLLAGTEEADFDVSLREESISQVEKILQSFDEKRKNGPYSLHLRMARRLMDQILAVSRNPRALRAAYLLSADCRKVLLPGGGSMDLSRRQAMRLILKALVDKHRSEPGVGVLSHDLISAGWPDQTLTVEAGLNRLYYSIHTLRDLGLGEVLLKHDDGYLLSPQVSFEIAGGDQFIER